MHGVFWVVTVNEEVNVHKLDDMCEEAASKLLFGWGHGGGYGMQLNNVLRN